MATETITQITQPPEFIEAESKLYLDQLKGAIGGLKGADLSKILGPQFVAGLDPLTQQAMGKAGGLGDYAKYLQGAERLAGAAETTLGGIPTDIAASRGALGTATGDIAAARGMIGPTAYQQYMSPYQQDVIDTTLAEYDVQAAKGLPGLAAQAIGAGAFGGGREGVQRAEYQSASDRNRAALQAQLLQTAFGQAQQLAQQAQAQRMGVGAAQAGLAGQQLGLGQFQSGLASQAPGLAGQEIAGLTTLGGLGQAQRQSELSAQQQLASQQLYQPLTTAQQYGSGIMGLISGYPGSQQVGQVPVPGIAQTAIGAGTTLASLYGAMGGFNKTA